MVNLFFSVCCFNYYWPSLQIYPSMHHLTFIYHRLSLPLFCSTPFWIASKNNPFQQRKRRSLLYKFTLFQMTMSTGGDTSSVSSDRAGSVGSGISVPAASTTITSGGGGALQRPTELPLRDSTNDSISNSSRGIVGGVDAIGGRHSGNSSLSSVNSTKPPTSPSNSGKSNSVPGRGSSGSSHFDASQGMNLYKVIRGNTTSSQATMSIGGDPLEQLDRFDRIRAEIMSGGNISVHSSAIGGISVQRGASVGGGGRGPVPGTGSNSLGSATKYAANLEAHMANMMEKRRRSEGDEDLMKQMNVYLRTRTGSGKNLTDMEILSQVPVSVQETDWAM